MRLEDIVQDRKMFAEKVQENAAPDMARMGLEIVSFNVQNVTDEGNVIENLGIDRVVSISKSAQISRAESERDIAVAKANATKQANDARIEAETAIAERNNELEIKKQELKRAADVKKAEADAAYEIQQQEQRKTIEITTADANIAKQEKEIELREKEIAVKEKTLDADIRKQAEAEKYATQQKADAQLYQRQKEAEAKQFEIQKQAEAKKAQAEADRFAKEQEAEAVKAQAMEGVKKMEEINGKKFGDLKNPLLVSVRSGARASMPGMMDTILNLGLNDEVVAAMIAGNPDPAFERFVYDSYRRFIQMFSDVVMEVGKKYFEQLIDKMKEDRGVKFDVDLTAADLKELAEQFKAEYKNQ